MERYECVVAGLGPAGATALRDLSLAGIRAIGFDQAQFPRYKSCGGALSALAQQQITIPNWHHVIEDSLHTVHLSLAYGKEIQHTASEPICVFTMRDQFDHMLVQAAAEVGAEVRDGEGIQSIEVGPQGVTVTTTHGRLMARSLIGCDGANSIVSRCLGLPRITCGAALECEVEASPDIVNEHQGHVYLSYGTPAWGYGWVFPKANHLSTGVGSFSTRSQHLRQELERFLGHYNLGTYPSRVTGHLIPLGGVRRRVYSGPVLLAGDAAGFNDPLSGEGIAYALLSGHMAARHIITYLNGEASSLAGYQKETDTVIVKELALARWIAHKLYVFPKAFFRLLERSPETLALYFALIAGRKNYHDIVRHLKQLLLHFGNPSSDASTLESR